jgi:hypothetical protein
MSFGGRLAQIRATEASDPARRAWSSAEEFAFGQVRPSRLRAVNGAPSPRACFSRGERAGGVGLSGFR